MYVLLCEYHFVSLAEVENGIVLHGQCIYSVKLDVYYMIFRIVVSAPYGQAPGTPLQRSSNNDPTGVIYICPISPGQCEGLTGDGTGDDRRLYDVDG